MSRDHLHKLALIGTVAVMAGLWMAACGLRFPVDDLLSPLVLGLLLGGAAHFYHRRGEVNFVHCLHALLHITLYTSAFCVLMYAVAATGRPLVDDWLSRADAVCGVYLPAVVAWTRAHPNVERLLQFAYNSLLWQTPLVIVLLGFTGDRLRLEGFVRQFMIGSLICAAIFTLWPAAGPFAAYGFDPSPTQARYLEHLHGLREGSRKVVTWREAEGLITFPSFHTCWAILLAGAVRRWPMVFAASVLLNGLVIMSTLTTGWHYFADVLGGAATAGIALAASAVWAHQLEQTHAVDSPAADACPAPGPRLLPFPRG